MWLAMGLAGAAGYVVAGLIVPETAPMGLGINTIVGFAVGVLVWHFSIKKRMAQAKPPRNPN
jgi:F0F1-type ATP synthase assembly protein I